MRGVRRSASWPRLVAISLIGLGTAHCSSDSGRFSDSFGSKTAQGDVTGSVPRAQPAPAGKVETRPLPRAAGPSDGMSGGGRGMGSYSPGGPDITGALPPPSAPPPPRPSWSWEGGTPVTVMPGETLDTIARKYNVPVHVILQANNLAGPAAVHPGQHLVIPRYSANGGPAPAPRLASNLPVAQVGAPKTALTPTAGVHVVAPGETLNSISRLYGKSVVMIAKANNIPPNALLKVGERVVIPGIATATHPAPQPAPALPPRRAETPPPASAPPKVATTESPSAARMLTPAPAAPEPPAKAAQPAGAMPSFRWPVHGRVIVAYGPKPNGLQNDGINLAVPEGTPIKAAEDGVIAYAGNELKGYGNLVLVRHSNGYVTAYAHASEILVKRGDQVKRGQVIARSGQSGNVTSPQLHFEIRKGATPVDPMPLLAGG